MMRANTKTKDPSWQLQEAKSRLSQVVDHAVRKRPQTITLRGKPAVVDSLIAVSANVHGLIVVTRNVQDIARC